MGPESQASAHDANFEAAMGQPIYEGRGFSLVREFLEFADSSD